MNLDYKILWFEDSEEWYEAILPDITEYLIESGFILIPNRKNGVEKISDIFENDDYDLILMDYNLVGGEIGDKLIDEIRKLGIYIDVIFYSQMGEKTVRDAMTQHGLDGVYCASRDQDDFLDKVQRVIKTTIKKVEDLNNIRGLVMASTSELDLKMNSVINKLLSELDSEQISKQKTKIIERFKNSLNDRIKKISGYNETHFDEFLLKTESYHKWMAIKSLSKLSDNLKQYEKVLENYKTDIIDKRNLLAHVIEEIDIDGNKKLVSKIPGYDDYIFNEAEAIEIRNNLRKYSELFSNIIEN